MNNRNTRASPEKKAIIEELRRWIALLEDEKLDTNCIGLAELFAPQHLVRQRLDRIERTLINPNVSKSTLDNV